MENLNHIPIFNRISVRVKFLSAMLLLSIVSLSLATGINYAIVRYYTLYEMIDKSSSQSLKVFSSYVNEYFKQYESMLKVYSSSNLIKNLDENEEFDDEVLNLFKNVSQSNNNIMSTYAGCATSFRHIHYPNTPMPDGYNPIKNLGILMLLTITGKFHILKCTLMLEQVLIRSQLAKQFMMIIKDKQVLWE